MRLTREARTRQPIRFVPAAGANHFLNDGPAEDLIQTLESCIPAPPKPLRLAWPRLAFLQPAAGGLQPG
jgi:hypothetical protein